MGNIFLCLHFFPFQLIFITLVENSKLFHLCHYLPCLTTCTVTNNILLFFHRTVYLLRGIQMKTLLKNKKDTSRFLVIITLSYNSPELQKAALGTIGHRLFHRQVKIERLIQIKEKVTRRRRTMMSVRRSFRFQLTTHS